LLDQAHGLDRGGSCRIRRRQRAATCVILGHAGRSLSHYTGQRNLCTAPGRRFVIGKPDG
jgi:hypothetical protein